MKDKQAPLRTRRCRSNSSSKTILSEPSLKTATSGSWRVTPARHSDFRNHTRPSYALTKMKRGGTAIPTPGGPQEVNIINESGLYNLIFTSRKPRAKAFRRWVTTAVLPSIRKTGRYDTKQDEAQPRLASSDDNVFVRVPRPPASTPFAHYIVSVTPEGSNVVEPSDFDPINAQRTELDLRLLAHKMLAVEILWIKARLLIPELSYKFPSLEGFHSAILDTSALANEIT